MRDETIDSLSRALAATPQYRAVAEGARSASGLPPAAAAWVSALRAEALARPALVILPREGDAIAWIEALAWVGHEAFYLPAQGLTPYQETTASTSVEARTSVALDRWSRGQGMLVCTPRALFRRLPAPAGLAAATRQVRVEDELPMQELAEHLTKFGYERVDIVSEPGEFALRGGVLDAFGPGMDQPLRIDYFGDTVESLRHFAVEDQRSGGATDAARLLPMALFAQDTVGQIGLADALERIEPETGSTRRIIEGLRGGEGFPGWQHYLGLAGEGSSLLEWFEDSWLVTYDPALLIEEAQGYGRQLRADHAHAEEEGMWVLPPDLLEVPLTAVEAGLEQTELSFEPLAGPAGSVDFRGRSTELFHGHVQRFPHEVAVARKREMVVVMVAAPGQEGRLRRWCEANDVDLDDPGVVVSSGELERGFELPTAGLAVYSDRQLFPRHAPTRTSKLAPFLTGLRDLRVGDYIVHRDHGIGQFTALTTMGATGATASEGLPPELLKARPAATSIEVEVMEISYAGGKQLLMPLAKIELIERYSGIESVAPKLDRLGGSSWSRRQDRVRQGVKRLAIDLLELYAARQLATAPAMGAPTDLYAQFGAAFEHEETPDQLEAIQAIFDDMSRQRPMDRLLCGDVGFGKTEVAMRAAFRAVEAGYQVAILAPTTILADQHLETLQSRFEGFPVTIEMVSRFRNPAEMKAIRGRLKKGEIDILVGTHRLLSKDIQLPALGLLVVDEEQRFGVAQKERLRDLKKNVHVLAMSATPVPRTLQLSLAGVRDLSVIESPPRDRMAVETATLPLADETVREAIEFELERGGQVFFVYNRVEGIEEMAQWLRSLVPGLRLTIGHGQLPERELASRMHAFKEHEHDVLLATTIIENGIDISNVNTMLIHRADRFGLSQLYQLRGRVGRGDRLAYCYLLVATDRVISEEARRRLSAIREFTELGAGFRVAARDLEIRGAGNLLGAEQSGHIAAVGLDAYMRLLEDTVRELRGEAVDARASAVIDLPVAMTIPANYIADANLRMEIYRRAASALDRDELLAELADRFGAPPASVETLIDVAQLKASAERVGIQSISAKRRSLEIRLRQDSEIDFDRLVRWIGERERVAFSPTGVLSVGFEPGAPVLELAQQTLREITGEA